MRRPRSSSALKIFSLFAALLAAPALLSPGCGRQGEGDRCDLDGSGNEDCDDGLVCTRITSQFDLCCPASGRSEVAACVAGVVGAGQAGSGGSAGSGQGGSAGSAGSGGSAGDGQGGAGGSSAGSAGSDQAGSSGSAGAEAAGSAGAAGEAQAGSGGSQ